MSLNAGDRINNTRYLGKEFLTWLWYQSDKNEGLVRLGSAGPAIQVWFADRIVLSGASQEAERVTIKAVEPSTNLEARTALQRGKQVEQARITIVREQREWTLTVSGEELSLGSIRIPALLTKDADDQLSERLHLLDLLDGMIVDMFGVFMELRADDTAWPAERDGMSEWIKAGAG